MKDIFNNIFYIIYVFVLCIWCPILFIYAVNHWRIFKESYIEYEQQIKVREKYCFDTYSWTATGMPNTIWYYCHKDWNYYLYTKSL